MKNLMKLVNNEGGQMLVLAALVMTVLIGFGAFAVDIGNMAYTKARLQNAADAAALAAAKDLMDDANTAMGTAIVYAGENGVNIPGSIPTISGGTVTVTASGDTITATTPYVDPVTGSDPYKIEVVCTRTVKHSLAKVLGLTQKDVSVRSVAEYFPGIPAVPPVDPTPGTPGTPGWDGGTVPFINYSHYVLGQEITIWDRVGCGNFNCLLHAAHDPYYRFDLAKGAEHKNGKVSNIKSELVPILQPGNTAYLISLSNNTIDGVTVPTIDEKGKAGSFTLPSGNAGNKVFVATQYLVLLKCTVISYDLGDTIKFRIEEIYDLGNPDTGDDVVVNGAPPTEDVPGIPGNPGTPGTPEVPSKIILVE